MTLLQTKTHFPRVTRAAAATVRRMNDYAVE